RPRLELHRQLSVLRYFMEGSEFFQQSSERHIDRRAHMDFLGDVQCQILNPCRRRNHVFSEFGSDWTLFACLSARSLTRISLCRQNRSNVLVHSCNGRMAMAFTL